MNVQPLNELHMWNWIPLNEGGLLAKAFPNGYAYKSGSIIMRSNFLKPVNRYVKNYIKGEKKFSLCIITLETDTEKMERWLDHQADQIEDDVIEPKFKSLGVKYEST